MTVFWKDLISADMAAMDKEHSLVLLPVGAIEQHGPHLPVGTDSIILENLMKRFVESGGFERWNVVVAPQLYVGKSNEHMNFAGTLTFTAETLLRMVRELCTCFARHGFKKILLTNAHGGNTDLLNMISRDLRDELGVEVYVFDWWFTPFWQDILTEVGTSKSKYGVFHACELETSLIMAIAPELVNEKAIVDETPDTQFEGYKHLSLFGPVNIGWKTNDVTKSGVIGEATQASREKGERFIAYAVDKLRDIVRELIQFHY